jgi:hypothetical protein
MSQPGRSAGAPGAALLNSASVRFATPRRTDSPQGPEFPDVSTLYLAGMAPSLRMRSRIATYESTKQMSPVADGVRLVQPPLEFVV